MILRPTASVTVALLIAGATFAMVPDDASAASAQKKSAQKNLILDNDSDCVRDDVPAPDPIGVVEVTKVKKRKLEITAEFYDYGGLSNERYHLEIGVQESQSACHGREKVIPQSEFTTTADLEVGKKTVVIKNPGKYFHIDVCNDDHSDCSFAGNFVYKKGRVSTADATSAR